MEEKKNEIQPSVQMTSGGLVPTTIEELYRMGKMLSMSRIVPEDYRGHPEDCMVALDIAARLNTPWLMVMQHLYVIKGKPALDSAMTTALVNMSGQFADPLEYEVQGKDVRDKDYQVRAYAKRRVTEKVLYGPWITWELVKSEGWYDKTGSKWKSMPEQMFHYRAASWFQRRYCPELTMGMATSEELRDIPEAKKVDSTIIEEEPKTNIEKLRDKLQTVKQEGIESGQEETEKKKTKRGKKKDEKEEPEGITVDEADRKSVV